MAYNFSSLSDRDLEELARELLSKELNIRLQSFKKGIDKGIDLRYSTNSEENEIIVQVKHYIESGFSKLKTSLKKHELDKVILLKPKRYILVTSIGLNPQNKEEIKKILDPFILSTQDIFGKDDLNGLLKKYPAILHQYFKLWLTNTDVIQKILGNATNGRSSFTKEKIEARCKIFVRNKTFNQSVSMLNKKNFILITGAPGIGKSTLADMLTYELLEKDFELVFVTTIREAEEAFMTDKKQVFYFDDFLGTVTLNLKSGENVDAVIVNFIERVKNDQQKRLILTCRTTILNKAKEESEKINYSKIDLSRYEVKIEDYSELDKARILYNHIYYSNLKESFKKIFFLNSFYWDIIHHKNYNPRIIEFFTDDERITSDKTFAEQVLLFLDSPQKIWEKPFTEQLSPESQLFLATFFSLGRYYFVSHSRIKEAFHARINFEIKNNNYVRRGDVFNKSLKELSGSFIVILHQLEGNLQSTEYKFLNPSIEDFLFNYFSPESSDQYLQVLDAAIYYEQIQNRIATKKIEVINKLVYKNENYKKLFDCVTKKLPLLQSSGLNPELEGIIALIRLFKWPEIQTYVIHSMNNFDTVTAKIGWHDFSFLLEILDYIATNKLQEFFNINYENILLALASNIPSYFQLHSLSDLINVFHFYKDMILLGKKANSEFYINLQYSVNKSWNDEFPHFIANTFALKNITTKKKMKLAIQKRINECKKINTSMGLRVSPMCNAYIFNYKKQLSSNRKTAFLEKIKIESLEEGKEKINEPVEINRLFNANDYDGLYPF